MSSDLALFTQLTRLALTFMRTHNIMLKEQNLEVITLFACMVDRLNLDTIGRANVTEYRISTCEYLEGIRSDLVFLTCMMLRKSCRA